MAKATGDSADTATADPTEKDESLKRLGGGRWQTRDERFTIEPQSGTWVVVDAEQTDDFGLALVRGPFGSLGAAKEAIATARGAEPTASPLAERVARLRDRPTPDSSDSSDDDRPGSAREAGSQAKKDDTTQPAVPVKSERTTKREPAAKEEPPVKAKAPAKPEPPAEPRWMRDLAPSERRRAKRLIERLTEAGAADPEGIVRRDVVGEVPAVAAFAVERALSALDDGADAAVIIRLLAGGRDDELGVRWKLVDGDDRPITINVDALDHR